MQQMKPIYQSEEEDFKGVGYWSNVLREVMRPLNIQQIELFVMKLNGQ